MYRRTWCIRAPSLSPPAVDGRRYCTGEAGDRPRQRFEQYFTCSQSRDHFLRQVKGRPQTAQSLVGRSALRINQLPPPPPTPRGNDDRHTRGRVPARWIRSRYSTISAPPKCADTKPLNDLGANGGWAGRRESQSRAKHRRDMLAVVSHRTGAIPLLPGLDVAESARDLSTIGGDCSHAMIIRWWPARVQIGRSPAQLLKRMIA